MSLIQRPQFKEKYDNYIGGKFVAPVNGNYFDVLSPIDGKVFSKAAHSSKEDLTLAVDTAHEAFKTWSKVSPTDRSNLLFKIAQVMEDNLEYIAAVETVDNGKAVRETLAADIPLAIDHFRYFGSVIRAEEGALNELDEHTVSLIVNEPLGVIAQIIPWNFPILMAVWKLAPALAAGNCVVLKPAELYTFDIDGSFDLADQCDNINELPTKSAAQIKIDNLKRELAELEKLV